METTEIFKNALNLSAEELTEVGKIKDQLCKVIKKDFYINCVSAGFSFFEVSLYSSYMDCYTYRIMQDGTTYIHTILGLIQINDEIGEVILNEIRNRQLNDKFIDVKLLPL